MTNNDGLFDIPSWLTMRTTSGSGLRVISRTHSNNYSLAFHTNSSAQLGQRKDTHKLLWVSVCIFLSLYENIDNCKDIHVYFFYNRSKAESLVINIIHELIWQGCKIDLSRLKNIFRWFVCIKHRLIVIHSSSLGDVYRNNALIKNINKHGVNITQRKPLLS